MTEKLIPFDLTTALAHPERVRTRDGRKVAGVVDDREHFPNNLDQSISAIVCGIYHRMAYWRDGRRYHYLSGDNLLDSPNDLMLTEPQPDANGWYRISEATPPRNVALVFGWRDVHVTPDLAWTEHQGYYPANIGTRTTHWRYPKPPVELEGH